MVKYNMIIFNNIDDFETPKKFNMLSVRKRKDKGKSRLVLSLIISCSTHKHCLEFRLCSH